jgi:hypothetical protein
MAHIEFRVKVKGFNLVATGGEYGLSCAWNLEGAFLFAIK